MIKISAPNRLRIAAIERLFGGWGPSCVVDDVSPHHRQTQSLWRASTGSEQRSETYAKLSKLHNVWRCGAVEYGFARFANVPRGPQAWGAVTQTGFARQALDRPTRIGCPQAPAERP